MSINKSAENISIPEFYNGKSVFVTGGMGFVGKVIVEKLLRSCPGIENVYLLVRSKKDKKAAERISEIIDSRLFDIIRKDQPEFLRKIILLEGDVEKEELGLSKEDQTLICDKVSVIIHSAATLTFDEPLKIAIRTNLQSIKEILDLSRKIKNFKAFVHVSTAYTNYFEPVMEEKFYKTQFDPLDMIKLANILPDDALLKIRPMLLGRHVNSYTFTKALAERLIEKESKGLPVAIVRPSAVLSTIKEPFEGWVDNYAGPTFFLYTIGRGLSHSYHIHDDNIANIIPADTVANMTIATGWKAAISKENSPPEIYHCSGGLETVSWAQFLRNGLKALIKYPLEDTVSYPWLSTRRTKLAYQVEFALFQYIPAYLTDFAAGLLGKKKKMVKYQDFIYKNYKSLTFATTNHIVKILGDNKDKLINSMSREDRQVFPFDMRKLDWKNYPCIYIKGIRTYLLNQNPNTIPASRMRLQKLKHVQYFKRGSTIALSVFALGIAGNYFYSRENREKSSEVHRI